MANGGLRQGVPAGFLAREAAWSLDALVVGSVTAALTWPGMAAGMRALRLAWTDLQQVTVSRMGDVLLQAGDPEGLTAQLMADPDLHAAAVAVQAALNGLLMPPLLVFAGLAALYWIGFERSAWQATPGKRALGLQVTDLEGERLGFARAAVRHFAGLLSWLTLNLGHALAALPPHKRALHDHLAATRVVQADGDPRLPGWAKAWIAVQVLIAFALPAWLLLRYVAMLQAVLLQG